MPDVRAESALELREAILGHDTWGEPMPELAGFTLEKYVTIDGDVTDPAQLPPAVLGRLRAEGGDMSGHFAVVLGRKINSRYASLSDMYAQWPEGQKWEGADIYDDSGTDAAFLRVSRSSGNIAIAAYYFVSAMESFVPDQLPLCDARLKIEDITLLRRLIIDLGNKGGSLADLARALRVDLLTGAQDPDVPEVESMADLWVRLAEQRGEVITPDEAADLQSEDIVADAMTAAELELQPLINDEVLAVAALARKTKTSVQF